MRDLIADDSGADDLVSCLDSDVKSSFTAALLRNDESGAVVSAISTTVSMELDAVRENLKAKYPAGYSQDCAE
jgi:hypothetical protein